MIRRSIDGLLLLDKPCGISSNAALQDAKRLYRAAKAGHAGTLDPLASGLLPVLFGEATKFSGLLLDAEKEYLAQVRLGIDTTTGDAEGEVLRERPVAVAAEQVELALAGFRGTIGQVPPMHSALKRDGKPLYLLARQGAVVERAPRQVSISRLEMLALRGAELELRVRCSKGTYIRSLAIDLGAALGTGAHLSALRRTASGGHNVADAISLDELRGLDEDARDARLKPLSTLLAEFPVLTLQSPAAQRFAHGQPVAIDGGEFRRYRVLGGSGNLLGVGEAGNDGMLRPVRLLASAAEAADSEKTL